MPRVKRTRLRRSGIRKMFRNFSSIVRYPLWARSPCRKGVLLSYAISRFSIDYESKETTDVRQRTPVRASGDGPCGTPGATGPDFRTWETTELRLGGIHGPAQNHGLPPGFLDLFRSRLGKLVSVDRDRRSQLARTQDLDQGIPGRGQPQLPVILQGDFRQPQFSNPFQVDDRVLRPKDVGESALRQPPVQRHLAAFEAAHQARTGPGPLALVAAGGRLAHAGSHTAADTLALRVRLPGSAQIR